MKMLRAKLYAIEEKKRKEKTEQYLSTLSDVSFGHQIRTLTLTPYTMVKDHRTGYEITNADAVLDGDLQDLILSHLRSNS